jgi:hypothetical protein
VIEQSGSTATLPRLVEHSNPAVPDAIPVMRAADRIRGRRAVFSSLLKAIPERRREEPEGGRRCQGEI